ncbi:60S acidic ribosomal protein P0 [Hondaea fermentalgiana]|uniref:60S acidic ribosomal protein P0 n=1 Tax=Hondaea fermentalgiana TaxID=2315210 RepID=A0A2R5GMT5_9STRA|nr:60S acidic ribosomal protein P0 [Hondaea fermentalgiana]|eukprot:GBG32197.1 60S acidic ribosomal protein P0 [Hondaea fermentalgiana]
MPSRERKAELFARTKELFAEYNKILLVGANNVGSKQIQQIRIALRGQAVVLFGKNTMQRTIIREFVEEQGGEHPIAALTEHVVGNIGFIFTNDDVSKIREVIDNNRVPAMAKAGQTAEVDVVVPPGPTGCDPGQTAWFQALNVPTKISRGQIEIVNELKLVSKGEVVGGSEAALLQRLDIRPFTYGFVLQSVYDKGNIFDAKVLDITEADLQAKFINAVRRMASISLQVGYPTLASLPHSVGNGVRTLIAVSAAAGYSFEQMEEWDKLLNMDPEELAKLAAASAAAGGAGAGAGEAAAEEEAEEEEEVDVGGGDLFGGGGDGGY